MNYLHRRIKMQVKNWPNLLKEKGVFSTFFSKVRQVPYNDEKCAKNTLFFKQKRLNFELLNGIIHKDTRTCTKLYKGQVSLVSCVITTSFVT